MHKGRGHGQAGGARGAMMQKDMLGKGVVIMIGGTVIVSGISG